MINRQHFRTTITQYKPLDLVGEDNCVTISCLDRAQNGVKLYSLFRTERPKTILSDSTSPYTPFTGVHIHPLGLNEVLCLSLL